MLKWFCAAAGVLAYCAESPVTLRMIELPGIADARWSASTGLIFAATAGGIVPIDPTSANLTGRVLSREMASMLAISPGGDYLFAFIPSRNAVQRYSLPVFALESELALPVSSVVSALGALPGVSPTVLISHSSESVDGGTITVWNSEQSNTLRTESLVLQFSIDDGSQSVLGFTKKSSVRFVSSGVEVVARSVPISDEVSSASFPKFGGADFVATPDGSFVDLETSPTWGVFPSFTGCPIWSEGARKTVLALRLPKPGQKQARLFRLDPKTATPVNAGSVELPANFTYSECSSVRVAGRLSVDSFFAVFGNARLAIATLGRLESSAPARFVEPVVEPSGLIRIPISASGLAFDSQRNLVWGVASANGGELANSAFSLDPVTGNIKSSTAIGSNPFGLSINSDASRIFTVLAGSQMIGGLELSTNQPLPPFRVGDPAELVPSQVIALRDANKSVAVIRSYRQGSYVSDVAIFDDSLRRGTAYPDKISSSESTAWGQSLSSLYGSDVAGFLYGAQTQLEGGDSSNRVVRLAVDASGIRLDKELPPLVLGTPQFGRRIALDRGSLYTGGGQVFSARDQTLEGRFEIAQSYAAGGVPIVLPDRDQIAYIHGSFLTRTGVSITLYDLTSRRPVATLPIPLALEFTVVPAAVRAGDSIVIAGTGQILIVPLRSIPPVAEYLAQPEALLPGVSLIRLPIRRMRTHPVPGQFVASIPSRAGAVGNTIAVVDSLSGQIVQSVFAGSEPAQLLVTPDASTAYTFAEGERRLAVIDLRNGQRTELYALDPEGKNRQHAIVDMALRPGGGIAAAFGFSGSIAMFDGPNPGAIPFLSDRGSAAFTPGLPFLLFNEDGTRLYSYSDFLSIRALNRLSVSKDGIRWLSANAELPYGAAALMRQSRGLIYTNFGAAIDPETSRVVASFSIRSAASSVLPDPDSNRVFYLVDGNLLMFDMQTKALLGSLTFPRLAAQHGSELIHLGAGKLAFRSPSEDAVVVVSVDAIPLLPNPVPSPQVSVPATPDVAVIDLAANALAYDPSRNRLYASTPNREASRGDQVFAIDLGTDAITKSWHIGSDPRQLALTADSTRLFVSSGFLGSEFAGGFSTTSSAVSAIDPDGDVIGEPFPARKPIPGLGFRTTAMVSLRNSPRSIAVLEGSTQAGSFGTFSYAFDSLRIYDNGDPRPGALGPNSIPCSWLAAGAPDELLCSSPTRLYRLRVDPTGVSSGPAFPLLLGPGEFTGIAVAKNRMFTSTGVVFDLAANRNLARLETKGHVVTDGEFVAWVDTWTVTRDMNVFTLRVFDAATLAPRVTKEVIVANSAFSTAAACGPGCVAFSSGTEIYVVRF